MMALTAAGLAQQQPAPGTPTALPSPPAREPAWAFPVIAGQLPAEPPGPKTVPGSTKRYTPGADRRSPQPARLVPRRAQAGAVDRRKGHGRRSRAAPAI